MGPSDDHHDFHIPSLQKCPITGMPIRHDPRWVVIGAGPAPYRAEFSIIGCDIVHAHIDGNSTLDIAHRYLDMLDALCQEIGLPVYFIEDYSRHREATVESRNYYMKRQHQNHKLAALVFYGTSPFFRTVILVGRFLIRRPAIVELAHDYSSAIKLVVSLQERTGRLPLAPASIVIDKPPNWKLEKETFTTSYWALPGNILFGKTSGEVKTAEDNEQLVSFYGKVVKEWWKPGRDNFRLIDWTEFKYISWKARLQYLKSTKNIHNEYYCPLAAIYGMSPFIRTVFNISRHLYQNFTITVASDFNDGLEKIRAFAAAKPLKRSYEQADSQVHDLLDFIGAINWEQSGIVMDWENSAAIGSFRPLYEAIAVLKHDYDEIIRDKQAAQTHEKELEEKLHLAERMKAIGMLAGGIAHDFNNQLTAVMGYADLIKSKGGGNNEVCKYADSIILASQRSAKLTAQLLAFARKGKYILSPVNMHALIDEVASILSHSIDKKITIRKELAAPACTIVGDQNQLQSALLNLAINARDAMTDGGDLLFSTQTRDLSAVECDNPEFELSQGPYVCIQVIDTGCGMTEEIKKHLFEPFFTSKEPGKGTGLGLPAVYGVVKNHKGSIRIISEGGRGTTVELLFPCAPTKEPVEEIQPPKKSDPFKRCRVLLIEDEPDIRIVASQMLTVLGHEAVTAGNGKAGIDIYDSSWKTIDLVLLDLIMPGMSGVEVFYQLKRINPAVRVVISSGYSIEGEAQKLITAGAKGFIQKPFKASELAQAVSAAVNNGQG